jgi:ribosomal protein L24E
MTWNAATHTGSATCSTTLNPGPVLVRAGYGGDVNFTASTSPGLPLTAGKVLTTTAVTSNVNPNAPLQLVTFTATVTVSTPGAAPTAGTAEFLTGAQMLCAAAPVSALGVATCTVRIPVADLQTITAIYSGSSQLATSRGSMIQHVLHGYWLVAGDGGIFTYGQAKFYGSTGGMTLNKPVVGMASTPDGHGYWLVASDGGIFAFGDAKFYGSTGSMKLNAPVVGIEPTTDGKGYWLVASDGGIFAFGDARFHGSTGSIHLKEPIVGIVATLDNGGYYLVASDGGIFAFGDAKFHGSAAGSIPAGTTVVGLADMTNLGGYWIATSTGKVLNFGDADIFGSVTTAGDTVVGMVGTADGGGYWLDSASGGVYAFGDAQYDGSRLGQPLDKPLVGMADI